MVIFTCTHTELPQGLVHCASKEITSFGIVELLWKQSHSCHLLTFYGNHSQIPLPPQEKQISRSPWKQNEHRTGENLSTVSRSNGRGEPKIIARRSSSLVPCMAEIKKCVTQVPRIQIWGVGCVMDWEGCGKFSGGNSLRIRVLSLSGHTQRGSDGQETGRIWAVLFRYGVWTVPAMHNMKRKTTRCAQLGSCSLVSSAVPTSRTLLRPP